MVGRGNTPPTRISSEGEVTGGWVLKRGHADDVAKVWVVGDRSHHRWGCKVVNTPEPHPKPSKAPPCV